MIPQANPGNFQYNNPGTNIYQGKPGYSNQNLGLNNLVQPGMARNGQMLRNRNSRTNQEVSNSRNESNRSYDKSYPRSRSFNTYTIESKNLNSARKRKESTEIRKRRVDYYALGANKI